MSSIHMFWSTIVNNKDYSQSPATDKLASMVVAQRSIESDDDCLSDDDDCFEFDEKLLKQISGGSSSAATANCVSKIGEIVGSAIAASTQTTTTTTTMLTKDLCPRRFSDCASDAIIPELSTQPSMSAQSSGSSSSQDKLSVVAVVGGASVVVGGGDQQQQQQQKRGGSLDSGMRKIRMENEPEPEEEEHHLLHLLQPQGGIIGGRGGFICGNNSWCKLALVRSEPKPEMKKCKLYCLDAAEDEVAADAAADRCRQ